LGKALHACGVSTVRLEETLGLIAGRLGVPLQVFAQPTGLFVAVGKEEQQTSYMLRVEPAGINLERLALLDALATDVSAGALTPKQGLGRVAEILAAPPRYGPWLTTLAFLFFSASVAVFFRCGWIELIVSAALGLATGLLALWAAERPTVLLVFEFLAAAVAAFLAGALTLLFGCFDGYLVLASGLIVLMPGLTLTTGVNELANRHLAAGTARLAGAGVVFLALIFGTAVGKHVAELLPIAGFCPVTQPLPAWTEVIAIFGSAVCLMVLFQARPRDGVWVVLSAFVAIGGTYLGRALRPDPALEGFLAAFIVGLSGNLYGRHLNRPPLIFLIPGITMLVPGVVGYRSLSALLEKDVVSGINIAFEMSIIAISLVAGLLFSNVLLPSRAVRRA
jgi:uncharacterized membrane protein YjjP (DUF1212 family)